MNLKEITPDYLGFKILSDLGDGKMRSGLLIDYIVKPIFKIPMRWTTEIQEVVDLQKFVDTQRKGPYKYWHHTHHFEKVADGTMMTDVIRYALPLGLLGRIANSLFVKAQLKSIFSYRYDFVEKRFNQ